MEAEPKPVEETTTLIDVFVMDGSLHVVISLLAILALIAVALAVVGVARRWLPHYWHVAEVDVALGGIGGLKIRRTNEVVRIAHHAHTELVTRKAGLPIDPSNDVITQVYDSWYELFSELRLLTKSVPAEKLRSGGPAKTLVDVLLKAMNDGLRPHLTKWQARYRSWEESFENDKKLSPQEIQQKYPQYDDLVGDLKAVNVDLIGFANALDEIVHGQRSRSK